MGVQGQPRLHDKTLSQKAEDKGWGCGDGSVVVLQVEGSEFEYQHPCKKAEHGCMYLTLSIGSERYVTLIVQWPTSLAKTVSFQFGERPVSMDSHRGRLLTSGSGLPVSVHACGHLHTHTHVPHTYTPAIHTPHLHTQRKRGGREREKGD